MIYFLRLVCLVFSLTFVAGVGITYAPAPALAQPNAVAVDYKAWEKTAARADEAISAGRASSMALDELRNEISNWRQQFLDAQSANSNAIATVQDQLKSLGPVPEDGHEAADIAAQREELNRRLSQLLAPVKTAELAHSRAEGLIRGIDQIIRDRQTQQLLEFGPSPLNPVHWPAGVKALFDTLTVLQDEFVGAWKNPVLRKEATGNAPKVLIWLLVGLVLVARGRRWSSRLVKRILKDETSCGRWIVAFIVSLGQLFLPYAGTYAMIEAVYASGMVGLRTDILLSALLPAAFIFLLARWLAQRIFPVYELRTPPLNLNAENRYSGRVYGALLGLVVATFFLLKRVSEVSGWSEAATNVVLFPVMVVAGLLLLRLANLLLLHSRARITEDQTEETFRDRIARLLSRALMVLAVVAPSLAAIGYFEAAKSLMLPSLLSLLLIAALLVLHRLVTEVYVLLTGNKEAAAESLIPVLAGFMLVLLSLPVFALLWGARVAQLTELWTRFTEGVYIGGTRISPAIFITLAIVFIIGYLVTRLVQGALKNSVLPKTKMDAGGRNAVVSGVGYLGIFLSALIAITSAGIDLSSLAIVAGALSVGIGFGLQNIVSNFVSGIILLIERPISEGDWIEVGGQHGYVRDISVRSTRIETFDRTDVIVPNADLISGTVTNYTRGNTVGRVIVPVGVAYGTDTRKVESILREVAEAHPMVLAHPAPNVVFVALGASSLDFEIRAILRDVNWVLNVHSDMNHEIVRRFAEEGIEIPFAQSDIWIRNPEALTGSKPAQPAPAAAPASQSTSEQKPFQDSDDGDSDADPDR